DTDEDTNKDLECTQDSDCKREGCSGTLCYPVDAPEIATICNWEPEYACYKDISCGCVENKCSWQETTEFQECVSKARSEPMVDSP
ncbi:MAG: eight-cysteine-cluster domain-containing protein, partial [Nanoarchaeota archaeon]|nr:eight-cysteine-cluster domain-containing protein [Nanoarchaeota archaeon]